MCTVLISSKFDNISCNLEGCCLRYDAGNSRLFNIAKVARRTRLPFTGLLSACELLPPWSARRPTLDDPGVVLKALHDARAGKEVDALGHSGAWEGFFGSDETSWRGQVVSHGCQTRLEEIPDHLPCLLVSSNTGPVVDGHKRSKRIDVAVDTCHLTRSIGLLLACMVNLRKETNDWLAILADLPPAPRHPPPRTGRNKVGSFLHFSLPAENCHWSRQAAWYWSKLAAASLLLSPFRSFEVGKKP